MANTILAINTNQNPAYVSIPSGGGGTTVTSLKTSAYAAQVGDYVQCDPSGAPFNVTLPSAAASGAGATIEVKNKVNTANSVTVLFTGGDLSDGQSSVDVSAFALMRFVSDGVSDWMLS